MDRKLKNNVYAWRQKESEFHSNAYEVERSRTMNNCISLGKLKNLEVVRREAVHLLAERQQKE